MSAQMRVEFVVNDLQAFVDETQTAVHAFEGREDVEGASEFDEASKAIECF